MICEHKKRLKLRYTLKLTAKKQHEPAIIRIMSQCVHLILVRIIHLVGIAFNFVNVCMKNLTTTKR